MTDRYSAALACKVSGLVYHRLDYAIRSGLFKPDVPANGKATNRAFSFRDLLALRAIRELRDAGVSLQAVRRVSEALRDYGRDLAGATLVVTGRGRAREVYVLDPPAALALLRRAGQLAAAWAVMVPLDRINAEVRAAVERAREAA